MVGVFRVGAEGRANAVRIRFRKDPFGERQQGSKLAYGDSIVVQELRVDIVDDAGLVPLHDAGHKTGDPGNRFDRWLAGIQSNFAFEFRGTPDIARGSKQAIDNPTL